MSVQWWCRGVVLLCLCFVWVRSTDCCSCCLYPMQQIGTIDNVWYLTDAYLCSSAYPAQCPETSTSTIDIQTCGNSTGDCCFCSLSSSCTESKVGPLSIGTGCDQTYPSQCPLNSRWGSYSTPDCSASTSSTSTGQSVSSTILGIVIGGVCICAICVFICHRMGHKDCGEQCAGACCLGCVPCDENCCFCCENRPLNNMQQRHDRDSQYTSKQFVVADVVYNTNGSPAGLGTEGGTATNEKVEMMDMGVRSSASRISDIPLSIPPVAAVGVVVGEGRASNVEGVHAAGREILASDVGDIHTQSEEVLRFKLERMAVPQISQLMKNQNVPYYGCKTKAMLIDRVCEYAKHRSESNANQFAAANTPGSPPLSEAVPANPVGLAAPNMAVAINNSVEGGPGAFQAFPPVAIPLYPSVSGAPPPYEGNGSSYPSTEGK